MKPFFMIAWLSTFSLCHAGDYIFTIEKILAQITRSAHFDTLLGAIIITVRIPNSDPVVYNATKVLGDHGGSGPDTFTPSNFNIHFSAPDNANVEISVVVINKENASGTDSGPLLDGLFTAVGSGIDAFVSGSTFKTLGAAIDTILGKLGKLRDLCDGTVIADALSRTPSDLRSISARDEADSVQDLGGESPVGCGANSDYTFWYRIHRLDAAAGTTMIPLPPFSPPVRSGTAVVSGTTMQSAGISSSSAMGVTAEVTSVSAVKTSVAATTSKGEATDVRVVPGSLLAALSAFALGVGVIVNN